MDTDKAVASLRALATGKEQRSKIGRVRELMPHIEDAKKAGVSMEKVLETLNANGLGMNMGTFKSALHRIRSKENKPAATAAKPTPKNEAIAGAHQVQQAAGPSKVSPSPVGTKVGEPKRFEWDSKNTEKPEW